MYWQKRFNEPNPDEEIEKIITEIVNKHDGNYGSNLYRFTQERLLRKSQKDPSHY